MKRNKTSVQNLSAYERSVHLQGRVWDSMALALMLMAPAAICIYFDAWPPLTAVLKALLGVAPMYWTVGVIEVLTFVPMLGTGGSYLGFVTGNLTNLKVPAALNAMQAAHVKAGSEEGDVISTIAIAASSIVTTLILVIGMLLLNTLRPVLESPALAPAFANVLPALFGGLGVVFLSKNWRIALMPMVLMLILFLIKPSMSSAISLLIPFSAAITMVVARVLYKRKMI